MASVVSNVVLIVPLYNLDPVMVSTSGHTLLEESAIKTLKEGLLPLATVVTPNLSEGFILAGIIKSGEPSLDQSASSYPAVQSHVF